MKAIVAGPGSGTGARAVATVPFTGTSPAQLGALARALGVDAVVAIERAVLGELMAEIEAELALGDDMVAQWLVMVRAVKSRAGRGIWTEPHVLELVPPVSYDALQRTFDMLIPDDTSMVAYIIEDDCSDVHASIIAVKRGGHIDLVTTHMAVADALSGPELARNWRRLSRRSLDLVSRRFARPSVAVFLERATLLEILRGPGDRLAREINARNVIIDPAPTWLLGLLGGATMAAMATRGAKALAMVLPPQARKMASDLAHSAQSAVRGRVGDPFALLGFDPIELWRSMHHFYKDRR